MMLTVSASAFSYTATGNNNNDKSDRVEQYTNQMVKTYSLNKKQAKKLKSLNEDYADILPMKGNNSRSDYNNSSSKKDNRQAPQQRDNKNSNSKSKKSNSTRMEAYNKMLKSILGDDNYSKYEKSMKKQGNNNSNRSDNDRERPSRD